MQRAAPSVPMNIPAVMSLKKCAATYTLESATTIAIAISMKFSFFDCNKKARLVHNAKIEVLCPLGKLANLRTSTPLGIRID